MGFRDGWRMGHGSLRRFLRPVGVAAALLLQPACLSPTEGPTAERLLVALKREHAVAVVDAKDTSVLGRLATGVGPHQVAVNPVLGWAVSANNGTDEAAGFSLSVMDPRRMRVVKTVALENFPRPHGVAFVGSSPRVVVTSQRESRSLVCDLRTGKVVREIPTLVDGAAFVVVGADGSRAYVTSPESGHLAVLDLDEGVLAARELLGRSLGQAALSPEGYELWIPDRGTDEVLIYDTIRLQLKDRIECSGGPVAVGFLPGRNLAVVACSRSSEVAFLHRAGRFELSRIAVDWTEEERLRGAAAPLTPVPFGLAVADSGNEIFVSSPNADLVTALVLAGGRGGMRGHGIPPRADWIRCRELSPFPPAFAVYIRARLAVGEDPEGLAWYRRSPGSRRDGAR